MKYIAILDTDDIEDFAFFEDGKEKYLHAIDANSENGEWIYLPFKPLEQKPILDKIKNEVRQTRKMYLDMNDIDWLNGCDYVLSVIDKYKAEREAIS